MLITKLVYKSKYKFRNTTTSYLNNVRKHFIVSVMGKLTSQLCKNEINANISFYHSCLPKLHENILEYYQLNVFKEITTGFNHSLQTTSKSPVSLFKKVNSTIILAFSLALMLPRVLLVSHTLLSRLGL